MKNTFKFTFAMLMGLSSYQSNAVIYKSAESTAKAQQTARDTIGKYSSLSAIGSGNGVLIAPSLYLSSAAISPADANDEIHFKAADGTVIESAKIVDMIDLSDGKKITHAGEEFIDPAHNMAIYVLEHPVIQVSPMAFLKNVSRANFNEVINSQPTKRVLGLFDMAENKKAAGTFKIVDTISISRESRESHHTLKGTFGSLKLAESDAGSVLFVGDNRVIKIAALYAPVPTALEKDASYFTSVSFHADKLQEEIDRYAAQFVVKIASQASATTPYLVGKENRNWVYGSRLVDVTTLAQGEHKYLATPSGKAAQETVLVNPVFDGGAVKIESRGQKVLITMQPQFMNVHAADDNGDIENKQFKRPEYSFEAPFGDIDLTFTVGGNEVKTTFTHADN